MSTKKVESGDANTRTLNSGVEVRISRVGQLLIDDAVNRVEEPKVPLVFSEDHQRDIENPNHPNYLIDMAAYERRQSQAAIDAAVLWGIELVEGLPEDEEWLRKLVFYSKRGHIDLSEFDLEEEFDQKYLYKRYIALDADELSDLLPLMISGVTEEDVQKAASVMQEHVGDERPRLHVGFRRCETEISVHDTRG